MIFLQSLDNIKKPFKNAVITIGNFDGVHLGHQALFHEVIERADAIGGTAIAMTFDPHPIRVMMQNGHPPLITLLEQKTELIEKAGLDVLICVPFTRQFATISAENFVKDILLQRIGMKIIVVGEDYTYGRNREGNTRMLRRFSEEMGFQVIIPDWIQSTRGRKDRISSTGIRQLVQSGDMAEARKMLGRSYQIRGQVELGRNRGAKLLGFPTANIRISDELCPKTGIYAVTVEHKDEVFMGVANIGYSPTFDDHIFTVEVHILDFNQQIYGEKIRVNFIERLRDEKKFSGVEELSEQIRKDIEVARKILA